jgi:sugar lactone lactonase YvrE
MPRTFRINYAISFQKSFFTSQDGMKNINQSKEILIDFIRKKYHGGTSLKIIKIFVDNWDHLFFIIVYFSLQESSMKAYSHVFVFICLFFGGCSDCAKTCYIYPGLEKDLSLAATSDIRWAGVAVSKDLRMFACYPNWSPDHSISVIDITDTLNFKPYPNTIWNTITNDPTNHFVCVQSVFIDKNNFLWVLDAGNPKRNDEFSGVNPGGAKLLKIDLAKDEIVQKIILNTPAIKTTSYLNDVRIDEKKNIAYLTDSNEGAIIIVDLVTEKARRVLGNHSSTKSEDKILHIEGKVVKNEKGEYPTIHANGLALSPDGIFLYWRALTAQGLYRINTAYLTNEIDDLGDKVEDMGSYFPPSDGMIFGPDGTLYLASVEENGIRAANVDRKIARLIKKRSKVARFVRLGAERISLFHNLSGPFGKSR